MLTVRIGWADAAGTPGELGLKVTNVGGGRVAHYSILDSDGVELEPFLNYARWSEPIHAFVARIVDAVRPRFDDAAKVARVTCVTRVATRGTEAPRVLAELNAEATSRGWMLRSTEGKLRARNRFVTRATSALAVTGDALCVAVWGVPELAPMPAPLAVAIRVNEGRPYVRLADIPPHVRPVFVGWLRGEAGPVIPNEGECVDASRWIAFIGPES